VTTTTTVPTPADAAPLAPALARAFEDDPGFLWLFPDASTRVARLTSFFEALTRHVFLPYPVSTMLEGHGGGAIWLPPGVSSARLWSSILVAPTMVGTLRTHLFDAMRLWSAIDHAHPKEPHHYLGILAVDPPLQGKGLGKTLIAPGVARADAEKKLCYLETAKETNLPFYRRHGFEVTEEVRLPGAPPMWCMVRQPKG
jgi:GNAT superfamily N-acetyltransferase